MIRLLCIELSNSSLRQSTVVRAFDRVREYCAVWTSAHTATNIPFCVYDARIIELPWFVCCASAALCLWAAGQTCFHYLRIVQFVRFCCEGLTQHSVIRPAHRAWNGYLVEWSTFLGARYYRYGYPIIQTATIHMSYVAKTVSNGSLWWCDASNSDKWFEIELTNPA